MTLKTLDKALSYRDIVNRLSHYPEMLRECDRGEEAENLDCLIEEIKFRAIND